ncbi:DUF6103 family protein [Clostridium pasteurianum]|uniref:Uncharacterized protein n=1 Tax=Clostridium pasteurianum BC1 TaxID=86416 RepID=R4K7Y6_CLOPA|nr:DUF6103 family protein [Clostridium pasteurianum]AGK96619.1 hypothetical protein Clopa_1697 [Clostridium pasteurianum BC1]
MKKTSLKLSYDEEKLKAISVALKSKNKNLNDELIKFLDGLYNKNVPKLLKQFIEESESSETIKETAVETQSE